MRFLMLLLFFFYSFTVYSQDRDQQQFKKAQGDLNLKEQEAELFDQLKALNFEEASFYEAYKTFIYNPSGKYSPFSRPATLETTEINVQKATGMVGGLKAYDIEALKVTSLIWDVNTPRALILDPTGQSHRVEVGTKIGRNDGYVAKIREGELIVIEKQKISGDNGEKEELFKTQVLKMLR